MIQTFVGSSPSRGLTLLVETLLFHSPDVIEGRASLKQPLDPPIILLTRMQ